MGTKDRHTLASRFGTDSATPRRAAEPAARGRPLDADARRYFEPRFAHDFSGVRIHTDDDAARATRELGAIAYTVGDRIAFAPGRYDPGSPAGRRLLAHELSHVVQGQAGAAPDGSAAVASPSSAAEAEADRAARAVLESGRPEPSAALSLRARLRASAPSQPTVLRAVPTWAGTWDTDVYKNLNDKASGDPIGVDIKLRFSPNDKVNATRIAITQTANSIEAGSPLALNKTIAARSIAKGPAAGTHIDQFEGSRNPLYATLPGTPTDSLGTTPVLRGDGAHGWRFVDTAGVEQKRDAWISDGPFIPNTKVNSSQTFESTALAIEGEQVGTWYGSVRWGWRRDAAGTFTRIPFRVVSTDVPSRTFRAAASLWNAGTTSTGAATIDLPGITGRFITADNVDFVSDPANPAATSLGQLAKNTRVEVTSMPGSGHAFNAGRAPADLWTKITVVDGVHIGKVGWVTRGFTGNRRVP